MKKVLFILFMSFASCSAFAQISPGGACPMVTHCLHNYSTDERSIDVPDWPDGSITVCQNYAGCATDFSCGCGTCPSGAQACIIYTNCQVIAPGGNYCFNAPMNGDVQLSYTVTVTFEGTEYSHIFPYALGNQGTDNDPNMPVYMHFRINGDGSISIDSGVKIIR